MRNPAKAILVAILIAIPAPFILGFLLVSFTPELFQILSQSQSNELATSTPFVLGSAQGIAAYVISLIVFGIVGFLAVAIAAKQPARATSKRASSPSRSQSSNQNYDDGEADYDDDSPEGDEEGTVKWFNVKKGFGFIVRDSGDEVFVHFRAIRGSGRRVLRQGQLVRFSVVDADKGLQADNVSILSD
ncbi:MULTISPECIES: cold-shock protein [Marinobacter]|uniref:Cold shock domain-containing protein n=1 Tax=Marinobacter xiaoshiensis TaxID=3073652 RepID=A0ABU2HKG3_9GAMM|nr:MULTISPECIES: cold shock domain-containing protein [unclassified Marinobacter]MBK1874204.1 cold shock domain-containing protein [Marinobacter sp. 1-3A]MDS1311558.1 cold shock domain-containing protein [Marinobacter sp. F60267]